MLDLIMKPIFRIAAALNRYAQLWEQAGDELEHRLTGKPLPAQKRIKEKK